MCRSNGRGTQTRRGARRRTAWATRVDSDAASATASGLIILIMMTRQCQAALPA